MENDMAYTLEQIRELTVNDVMKTGVLAADADWSLDRLAEFLVDNNISGAPVTNREDKLIGVVSLTDIVRQNNQTQDNMVTDQAHDVYRYELERVMGHEELGGFHAQPESTVSVRDIMTPMVFSVAEHTPLQEVAEMMLKGGIHRVFVTHDSRLVGIVTTLDMLQVIRDI
jgi:CBS domain-containing protein